MKTLLINMPYGAIERPALGLSLLKPAAEAVGWTCDIQYANLKFAEQIGVDLYRWIANDLPHTAFAGDATFTEALYGKRRHAFRQYLTDVLINQWQLDTQMLKRVMVIKAEATRFIQNMAGAVNWADYDVVGFTSTFEQNIASLAMAVHIKRRHPNIHIVFGGANWEGAMGVELLQRFKFVDYAVSGEADRAFPALLTALQKNTDPGCITGVISRDIKGTATLGHQAALVNDMNSLPVPDYADYFRALQQTSLDQPIDPHLLIETSRGCWWGAKSHCTFCGLNGGSMAFRQKSAERALDELDQLTRQWRVNQFQVVDNILSMSYFKDFLPALSKRASKPQLYYEVKSNLSRQQVSQLAAAGITRVQPGIESLSDHILQLMRKGTTGLRNVQMLKWCKEYGVRADWNLLYGFPGETAQDYQDILHLLPAIRHLDPPAACGPIRLDRFSPYFNRPADFGLKHTRPVPAYPHLYPFGARSARRLAYYFDFACESDVDPSNARQAAVAWADHWQRQGERGTLTAHSDADGTLILWDSRSTVRTAQTHLTGMQRLVYEYCDQVRTLKQIRRHVINAGYAQDNNSLSSLNNALHSFLRDMVDQHLMVHDHTHYLAMALWQPGQAPVAQTSAHPNVTNIPVKELLQA